MELQVLYDDQNSKVCTNFYWFWSIFYQNEVTVVHIT